MRPAAGRPEYYGPMIPRVMRLLRDGKYDEATSIYWQLHPARKAKSGLWELGG